jgi:hypothetical protein
MNLIEEVLMMGSSPTDEHELNLWLSVSHFDSDSGEEYGVLLGAQRRYGADDWSVGINP